MWLCRVLLVGGCLKSTSLIQHLLDFVAERGGHKECVTLLLHL